MTAGTLTLLAAGAPAETALAAGVTAEAALGGTVLIGVAFLLLAGGVVGSVVPGVPGALLSLVGVGLYWWETGQPGTLLLATLLLVGAGALAVDWLGGVLAARASGTSTAVSVIAGVVGVILGLIGGPIGLILGVAGSVFVITYAREQSARQSLRRALVTTAGVLASAAIQTLLTASILLTLVVVHLF
jgi:hypothetical protein